MVPWFGAEAFDGKAAIHSPSNIASGENVAIQMNISCSLAQFCWSKQNGKW